MSNKRTLHSFFAPNKRTRLSQTAESDEVVVDRANCPLPSTHATYPFPIPASEAKFDSALDAGPASAGKAINNQPDLDLLYFQPFVSKEVHKELFEFLRKYLFFYRVEYKIQRGPIETQIRTPRYTTVFGVDETSTFSADGTLIDSITKKPIPADRYKTCEPRPIPQCLDVLRKVLYCSITS